MIRGCRRHAFPFETQTHGGRLWTRPNVTHEAIFQFSLPADGEWAGGNLLRAVKAFLGQCVPGAQSVVIPNGNHVGPSRYPAAFSAAIFEFLAKR